MKLNKTAIVLALVGFVPGASAQAQYAYTTNNGTITITKYTGSGGAVTIPDNINGLPVTSIETGAFQNCTSLTSATIPKSVISIGGWWGGVFNGAFYDGCTSLKAIMVDALNSSYSSVGGVLFDKNQTVLIQHPAGKDGTSYTIPNSVTNIPFGAFQNCTSLNNMTIPNSVTSIGDMKLLNWDMPLIERTIV